MNFTIGNDFLIRGTRGETGTIHITFDSDMTGTKGVFLVKKTPETPDDAAYLVKKFTFGSNPSISGREVIISLVPDDTKFIPIEAPDSPYVFESDYRDVECIDYVWSIKVYGDDCTEMIIPGEGMKYPTFRLYNDAVSDRGGRPIVPECHHRKHHDDTFVTKRDLLHYATMDGRRHDEIVSGVEANETDIKQLNRSVLDLYQRINDSTSQSDNKLSALELKVETNAANVAKLQTSVDDISDVIDDFTDKFEEAGEYVYGVRSDRSFTSNRWAETPKWMLGATAAKTIQVVGKDCVSVDTAVDKLFEADGALAEKISKASKDANDVISSLSESVDDKISTANETTAILSGNAQTADASLAESIEQLKSLVGSGTETVQASVSELSGNAKTADDQLAKDIKTLNQGTSTLCTTLGQSITSLSGNAKTADESLTSQISALSIRVTNAIIDASNSATTLSGYAKASDDALSTSITTLSGNAKTADASLATSITALSGNAKTADTSLATSISTLSGNAKTADESLATAISTLSGNAKSVDDTVASSVQTLSGNAQTTDVTLATSISTLSGDAKTADANLSTEIANLKALVGSGTDTVQTSVSTLSGNAKSADEVLAGRIMTLQSDLNGANSSITTLSGNAKTADGALATSISTLSGNAKSADEGLATLLTTTIADYVKKTSISTELTASSDNDHVPGTLAAYNFINSSINNFAAFYITKNTSGDAFATKAELTSAISSNEFYNGGAKRTPTKNDYLVVLADESRTTDTGLVPTTRYSFDGTQWAFQYVVNNTSLTQAQVDALNSGVTSQKISDLTDSIKGVGTSVTTLSGNASSADASLKSSIDTLSGNAKNRDEALCALITTLSGNASSSDSALASSIQTLSGNAKTTDSALATSISTLSGNAETADKALAQSIASLSGAASKVATDWYSSYTTLSGNAKDRDDAFDSSIKTLSGNASSADSSLASSITTLSGNAKTADGALATSISTLSGNAKSVDEALGGRITTLETSVTGHESRITSLEQGRLFASLEEARLWTKTYVPGLVYAADGSADKSSEYTDKNVLKLVLGIVTKLASSPAYFESQTVANAWVKTFVPNIVLNADGTMTDASVFTDEEVMALVLGIVAKMASNH